MKFNKRNCMYYILLAITLSISTYSIYKYINNLIDKSETDKVTQETVDLVNPKKVKSEEDNKPYLELDLKPLKDNNADVVAWLKVGVVGIDMPIVQTTDNKFYLNHDINKNSNSTGWVFVDTNSSLENMGLNTVIFGHNVRGRHFGLLKRLLEPDISNNEDANIIQITTEHNEMVFEIVSMYVTHYTDWQYAKTTFDNKEDKIKFIDRVKTRNEVNLFDSDKVTLKDKYITLSTCHGASGTENRLVTHARLIASRSTNGQ